MPTTDTLGSGLEINNSIKIGNALVQQTEFYNTRLGVSFPIPSFEHALEHKLGQERDKRMNFVTDVSQKDESTSNLIKVVQEMGKRADKAKLLPQAEQYFTNITQEITPKVIPIIQELKKLGLQNDLALSKEFELLRYALIVDKMGEGQNTDMPKAMDYKYEENPNNPLNKISLNEDGKVLVETLNDKIDVNILQQQLQELLPTLDQINKSHELSSSTEIKKWVEYQAMFRSILQAKDMLKQEQISLEGATLLKVLKKGEDAKQFSNPVEFWQTKEGREIVLKRGAIHTLQAEVLENKLMLLMGIPVPETSIQEVNGEPVLVVGFLDKYTEENNPFILSKQYQNNPTLMRGLIPDLLLDQYNRRPHNVMMKEDKVAFIDHGGALFCRATGGFKSFGETVDVTDLWDNLRTIPDNDANGDVVVNEAYANVLTVEGGTKGEIVVNNPVFLARELDRLDKVTDEQIQAIVEAAGFRDGEESFQQINEWLKAPEINGRLEKLNKKPKNEWTKKDYRDYRWTQGALITLNKAKEMGGMRSYLIHTISARRDNLISFLRPYLNVESNIIPMESNQIKSDINKAQAA